MLIFWPQLFYREQMNCSYFLYKNSASISFSEQNAVELSQDHLNEIYKFFCKNFKILQVISIQIKYREK